MGSDCCKNTGHTNYMSIQTDQILKSDLSQSYQQAQKLVRKFYGIRKSVINCRGKVQSLTNLPLNHPVGLLQNLQVLSWALSASCQGQLSKTKFVIIEDVPYLQMDSISLTQETQELYNYLQIYLEVVITGCSSINKILDGFSLLNTELKRWKQINSANNEVKNMIDMDYQRLVSEMKEAEVFADDLHKINSRARSIITKTRELMNECDDIGRHAYVEGLVTPKEIVEKFQDFLYRGKRAGKYFGRNTEDSLQSTFDLSPIRRDKFSLKQEFFDIGDTQWNTQETVNSALLLTTLETNIDFHKENTNREFIDQRILNKMGQRFVQSTNFRQNPLEKDLKLEAKQRLFGENNKTDKKTFENLSSKKQNDESKTEVISQIYKSIPIFGKFQGFKSENIQDREEESIRNIVQQTPIKNRDGFPKFMKHISLLEPR